MKWPENLIIPLCSKFFLAIPNPFHLHENMVFFRRAIGWVPLPDVML
jgi:hypothetical protein